MNKKDARTHAIYELERLQSSVTQQWLKESLPNDWQGLDFTDPVERHKLRVTLRLDKDMLTWFRKLGPGYQSRINAVLRVYWTSLLAGWIKGYPNDDTLPRIALRIREDERRRSGPSVRYDPETNITTWDDD